MKESLNKLLILLFVTTQSFAACEQERERWEKNKSLCETWSKISGYVSTGGMVAGAILFGTTGGLCGGVGVIPGGVAFRICELAKEKKKILDACEQNQVLEAKRKEEALKDAICDQQARACGKVVAQIFMKKLEWCQQRAQEEIDELTERYIESGQDVTDPDVIAQIQSDIEAINKKYF